MVRHWVMRRLPRQSYWQRHSRRLRQMTGFDPRLMYIAQLAFQNAINMPIAAA
jgi:hypothetical protein